MQDYEILEELGRGGMGVVCRAVQKNLRREVAIKFLKSGVALDDIGRARFERELRILTTLSHPGIVKLFDAGEEDGQRYYVMELIEGEDLSRVMNREGRLGFDRAAPILDQLLDALDHLHGKGLIHRDVKPSNILISVTGRVVLSDFGLVRLEDGNAITAPGQAMGTPRYIPPEMIRGDPITPGSDLWSLGVVAYELFSGRSPFVASGIMDLLSTIVRGERVPLDEAAPDLCPDTRALVERLFECEPHRRWQSAADVRRELRRIGGMTGDNRLSWGRPAITLEEEAAPTGDPASAPASAVALSRTPVSGAVISLSWDRTTLSSLRERVPRRVIAALGGLGISLGLFLASALLSRGPAGGLPEGLSARYRALDEIEVTFRTGRPGQWTLSGGIAPGEPAEDEDPRTFHRLRTRVKDPELAPELTVVSGETRLRVMIPRPPAVTAGELARDLLLRWKDPYLMDRFLGEGLKALAAGRKDGPGPPAIGDQYRSGLKRVLRRLRDHLDGSGRITKELDKLQPFLPAILGSVSPDLSDDFLRFLDRLDEVDVLALCAEERCPYDVQRRLRPVASISLEDPPASPTAIPGRMVHPIGVAQDMLVFPPEDLPARGHVSGTLSDFFIISKTRYFNKQSVSRLTFELSSPAGSRGRRLHFLLSSLEIPTVVKVTPPGRRAHFPLRIPNGAGRLGPRGTGLLSLTLTGPDADRPGTWSIENGRVFQCAQSPFFAVHRIHDEPVRGAE